MIFAGEALAQFMQICPSSIRIAPIEKGSGMSFDGKVRASHYPKASFDGSAEVDNLKSGRGEFEQNQDAMTPNRDSLGKELFQNL